MASNWIAENIMRMRWFHNSMNFVSALKIAIALEVHILMMKCGIMALCAPSWKRKPQLLSTRWSDTSVKHIPQQRIASRIHKVTYAPPKTGLSTHLINDPRNTIENWPTASPCVVLIALNILNLNVICGYFRKIEGEKCTNGPLTCVPYVESFDIASYGTNTNTCRVTVRANDRYYSCNTHCV